jgi:hypothetical protein
MGRGLDHAAEIDARDHGEAAHHGRLAAHREAILVIDRRPFDTDGHVAVHQFVLVEIGEADGLARIALVDADRPEHCH